jgi:phage baseplate assembly protein W
MTEYNQITEFMDNVPGSNYRLYDINNIFNSEGDLAEIYNVDVIINSINNILRIPKGTYLDDPEFGVGIEKYLFEPSDQTTISAITSEVKEAISVFERRAKIDVSVSFFTNMRGFNIDIKVSMNGISKTTKVKIQENLIKNI